MRYSKHRRGADCKGQLSIPLVKKIDRSSWGTVRRSIFFVIIVFHLGKLCHDLKGQMDHIHDQTQQCEDEREKCESLQQSHSICPGCGFLHLLRALGGTRILQAAAPTATPCFRHWRRSLPLLFAFKAPGRALQKSFFPEPLLVLCKNRKTATRDRKHDHQFCNQRLIVILT